MVIDFHAHMFPDRLAERALSSLSNSCGGTIPRYDGTPAGFLRHMDETGLDAAVVLNIATTPATQKSVNNFTIDINSGIYADNNRLIAFGSVHPLADDASDELDRLADAGVKGIKFHPEYQGFYVNDEKVYPIYEKISKLGMISVFHSGADIGKPKPIHCTPAQLSEALPAFHGAPVVAAHFGAYMMWDDVEKYLVGRDIFFDTSYGVSHIPFYFAQDIVRTHGAERILFGSDTPWADITGEINFVRAFDLPQSEKEMILSGNARRLLGI